MSRAEDDKGLFPFLMVIIIVIAVVAVLVAALA